MKELTIKIGDKDWKLKYSIRALFLYERITGKSFEMVSLEDQVIFFYCILLAQNPDFMTFDEFCDAIDSGKLNVNELNKFVTEQQAMQAELAKKETVSDKKKKPSKKK